MSHFTVMVIGDDPVEQLAPYHEYECTGVDDEYVIDVDMSDEINEWLEKPVWVGIRDDNEEVDYHFSLDAAEEYMHDVKEMPRGQYISQYGLDMDEEVKDYFGAEPKEDGKYYVHTNPNAKWDWYQVGGRWSGFFKLKDPEQGAQGEQSLLAIMDGAEPVNEQYGDITYKGNIDIEGMMEESRQQANKQFDHVVAALGDVTPISWAEFRDSRKEDGMDMDEIRAEWKETDFQKALDAYAKEQDNFWLFALTDVYDEYYLHLPLSVARTRFVETAAANTITPFAFVKDGQWVERGEMGWWASVTNEKDADDWQQQFVEMFNALPDDTLITMVDCHI